MSELKPVKCSCGGNATIWANGKWQSTEVICNKCSLSVSAGKRSVKKWNQLQSHNVLRARIDSLEKEVAPFRDTYFKGLSMEAIAELAKKSIRLTDQHNKDTERIEKMEGALREAEQWLNTGMTVFPEKESRLGEYFSLLRNDITEALNALKGAGK